MDILAVASVAAAGPSVLPITTPIGDGGEGKKTSILVPEPVGVRLLAPSES